MATVPTQFKDIVIFCDGACSGNPGPGGWGSVVVLPDGHVMELGGSKPQTTNQQMEMRATIESLHKIESLSGHVVVYTDSVYVIRGITQWIWGWMKRGWKTAEGNAVSNQDYWQELLQVVSKRKKPDDITWKFVKGHSGVPGNERVDEIAVAFSKGARPRLFDGSLLQYPVPILDLPPDVPLPEPRERTEKKVAFSYLSLLGGTPMRHATWPECERRVKGQPGAKFKKAMSADEEETILRAWGVDPQKLKS